MEKKEFLNEETYQKGKKKLTTIALIVLICGLLIGGSLIVTGIVKQNNAKKANEQSYVEDQNKEEEEAKKNQNEVAELKEKISELQAEINQVELEINRLNNEKSKAFQEGGFSDRYYEIDQEIEVKRQEKQSLTKQLNEYESELFFKDDIIDITIDDEIKNTADSIISNVKYAPYYMFGAFIIIASCFVSLAIYLFAKRRDIRAFTIQQTMPVTQEAIGKMAPTVGNAAGGIGKEVAKGIASGIKEGLKGEESDK